MAVALTQAGLNLLVAACLGAANGPKGRAYGWHRRRPAVHAADPPPGGGGTDRHCRARAANPAEPAESWLAINN